MQRVQLEVKTRDLTSKEKLNNNRLRTSGLVPAVMYGQGEPVTVMVDLKDFSKAIHTAAGTHALFSLKIGGKASLAVIKEIQRDIFTRQPIHVDFQRISEKEKIILSVPIHTKGEAKGVKEQGGILEHILRELEIRCLPEDIPANIEIDVTNLELRHGVKVSEITPPKGVEILTGGDHFVVNIVTPKIEEVAPAPAAVTAEGAAAPAAQPEVIAKGKKEEEGAIPAAAPAAGEKPAKEEKKK